MSFMTIVYVPAIIVALVVINRYLVGSLARHVVKSGAEWKSLPTVTVLIPVYNEGESVYHTIRSLAAQTYPQDLVTIHALDDASGPETRTALERALAETKNLKVSFHSKNRGKRQNLIEATAQATSELILSVDSDCFVEPDALEKLVAAMGPDITAVGGVVRVSNADVNTLTRVQAVKYWVGYEFLKGLENLFDKVMCLSGCMTLYRRRALLEVEEALKNRNFLGGDVRYGEDRYLTRKLVEAGAKTRLCHDAVVHTKAPETFTTWFSQQLRWRRSNIVDYLGGFWYAHRLPLPVAIHYVSLGCIIFGYPIFIVHSILGGFVFASIMVKMGLCGILCMLYLRAAARHEDIPKIAPESFIGLPFLLMTSYLTITPLALFTLITKRWETRSASR